MATVALKRIIELEKSVDSLGTNLFEIKGKLFLMKLKSNRKKKVDLQRLRTKAVELMEKKNIDEVDSTALIRKMRDKKYD